MTKSRGRAPNKFIALSGANGKVLPANVTPMIPARFANQAVDITPYLYDTEALKPGDPVMVMLAHRPPCLGVVLKVWPADTMVRSHDPKQKEVPWDGARPLLSVKAYRSFTWQEGMDPAMRDIEIIEEKIDKLPWIRDVQAQARKAGYPAEAARQVHVYAVISDITAN